MHDKQLLGTRALLLATVLLPTFMLLTRATADTIICLGRDYNGTGLLYTWHYRYDRTGDPLTPDDSTWRLDHTVGVLSGTGPTYWYEDPTVAPDGSWIEWLYKGGEEDPAGNYETFDVLADSAGGTVPYEVDTDGDGNPDYNGDVPGPVPEPSTTFMMAFGLAILAWHLRGRRSNT